MIDINKSEIQIITGFANSGKTTELLKIACTENCKNYSVIFISTETSEKNLKTIAQRNNDINFTYHIKNKNLVILENSKLENPYEFLINNNSDNEYTVLIIDNFNLFCILNDISNSTEFLFNISNNFKKIIISRQINRKGINKI